MFFFPEASVAVLKSNAKLEISIFDALMTRHTIRHITGEREVPKLPYHPGLGIKVP